MAPISDTLIHEAARPTARSLAHVILFGSYAHGEPDAKSDIDFLVAQQDGFSHRREIVRLQETPSPLRIPAEILVVSHEEAAQPERAGDGVSDALAEGRRPL